jgi:N-acyl homoserine lactone hydrolase
MKVFLIQQLRTRYPAKFLFADAGFTQFEEISIGGILIEHPREGYILVDNGIAAPDALARWGGVLGRVNESVPVQISRAGIDPADIKHVIFTHLHFDHTGDVSRFTNARIWASKEELRLAKKAGSLWHAYSPLLHQWEYRIEPLEVWYQMIPELGPFPILKDLFGDQSVVIMFTPGHTAGAISVLVNGGKKKYFLCGDACYCRRNYREHRDHGRIGLYWADQKPRMARGVRKKLLEWERQDPNLSVIPAHDKEVWNNSPLFPSPL